MGLLVLFVFYYPLVMSVAWIVGAAYFYYRRERRSEPFWTNNPMPRVSLVVPAHNEADHIAETVSRLVALAYPNYELIVVDDGSSDDTPDILERLVDEVDNLRVIRCPVNRGKAHALNVALPATQGEVIVTVDADAALDPYAIHYLVSHFYRPGSGERVGAVTGNPRVRNRSSLLAKIQLVEYASIIGLIKRSQRIWGKLMTVSGVVVAFRKRAVVDSGFWDTDLMTEDIAVTWKMEQRFWDVRYEPRALCWMLVPETIAGLWAQRLRWAEGGLQVVHRYWRQLFHWRQRRLWPVLVEHVVSVVWSLTWVVLTLVVGVRMLLTGVYFIPIVYMGAYLAVLSLVQAAVALFMDMRYEQGIVRYYWWSVWYPAVYWFVNAFVVVYALGRLVVRGFRTPGYAVWTSPNRGLPEGPAS